MDEKNIHRLPKELPNNIPKEIGKGSLTQLYVKFPKFTSKRIHSEISVESAFIGSTEGIKKCHRNIKKKYRSKYSFLHKFKKKYYNNLRTNF